MVARPAFVDRSLARRGAPAPARLRPGGGGAARTLHGAIARAATGGSLDADGTPWRSWPLGAGVRAGLRTHAVRPVPCLYRRPAHAGGIAEHRGIRDGRGRRSLLHRARGVAAAAQAGTVVA